MYLPFKKSKLKAEAPRAATSQSQGSEREILAAFDPPFILELPSSASESVSAPLSTPLSRGPLIFASPHSGNIYPPAWLAHCRLTQKEMRQSEDIFVDELFAKAPDFGAAFLKARFPRSFVDVNRSRDEIPASWVQDKDYVANPRTASGLGVIPMAIGHNQPIYQGQRPSHEEGLARLEHLYAPYHAALEATLEAARVRCGRAILVDCHSMPGFTALRKRHPDFVLGDRYGKACAPALIDCVQTHLQGLGYTVARNYPYAGGYVTQHYGRPHDGVDVLQIEINRELYVNSSALRKNRGFDNLQEAVNSLMARLSAYAQDLALSSALGHADDAQMPKAAE